MNYNNLIISPLEQFQVLPIIPLTFGIIDISLTNEVFILALILFITIVFFYSLLKEEKGTFFIIPTRWQSTLEIVYKLILSLVVDNIRDKNSQYFFL